MALFEIESVLHKNGMIRFTWHDVGGTYKVYRDDHLLYEGTVASFQDGQVEEGEVYDYSIERIVDEIVVDVIRLQTSAYTKQKNQENPLQSLVLTTIVSKSQIVLYWEKMEGVHEYEIYKNNLFLKKVRNNYYIDQEIETNETSIYRIESKRPVMKSETYFNISKALISTVLELPNSLKRQPAMEVFKLMKKIERPTKLLKPTEMRRKIQIDEWRFRYTTFIKDPAVKNPNLLSRNHTFQGDGRDFHPEGTTFRTRVDLSLHYKEPKWPMICTKYTGETVAYNRFGKVRETAKAAYNGIKVERKDRQIGGTEVMVTHDVQNPLVQGPRLNYKVCIVFRKDGVIDLTGFHNQAPHHEIYLMKDEKRWEPIYLAESNGLIWLSDLTNWRYWRYSNMR